MISSAPVTAGRSPAGRSVTLPTVAPTVDRSRDTRAGLLGGVTAVLIGAVAFLAARSPALAASWGAAAAGTALLLNLPRLRPRLPDLLAVGTGVWALATTWWTVYPELTRGSAYTYAVAALAFVATRQVLRTRAQFVVVGYAFLAGCAAATVTLISGAGGDRSLQRASAFDYSVRYGIDGININYTAYALLTGLVVGVVLWQVGPRTRTARVVLAGLLALLGYGILLTGTKGATLGVLLGAVYLGVARIAPGSAWRVARVGVPALLVLIPVVLSRRAVSEVLWLDGLFGRSTGDLSGRLEVWPYAWKTWGEAPLAGIGSGAFPAVNPFEVGAHDLLLTLGLDLGLVGMVLYAATFATALHQGSRATRLGRLPLVGLYPVCLLPVWVSGHWENAQPGWVALAMMSVLVVATSTGAPARRPAPADARPLGTLPPRLVA